MSRETYTPISQNRPDFRTQNALASYNGEALNHPANTLEHPSIVKAKHLEQTPGFGLNAKTGREIVTVAPIRGEAGQILGKATVFENTDGTRQQILDYGDQVIVTDYDPNDPQRTAKQTRVFIHES